MFVGVCDVGEYCYSEEVVCTVSDSDHEALTSVFVLI